MFGTMHNTAEKDLSFVEKYLIQMASIIQKSPKNINLWALDKLYYEVKNRKEDNVIPIKKLLTNYMRIDPTQSNIFIVERSNE